jgi:hypothetical protein
MVRDYMCALLDSVRKKECDPGLKGAERSGIACKTQTYPFLVKAWRLAIDSRDDAGQFDGNRRIFKCFYIV